MRGPLRIACITLPLLAAAAHAAQETGAGLASLTFSPEQLVSRDTREKVNDASPAPGVLVAAGEEAGGWFAGRRGVVVVAAAALPRSGSGYLPVSAMAIDGGALRRLDDAQLRALLEFVGYCGRVLFVDAAPHAYRAITGQAGCGGRYTAGAQGAAALTAFDALLARAPRPLPGATELRRLLGDANPDLRLAGFFLGGFLLLFLALAALRPARAVAVPFCLLATVLPGLLWAGGSRHSSITWAEARADDAIARYARLDIAAALGRGDQRLAPAALGGTPDAIDGPGVALHWSDLPQERGIEWSARLLQELRLSSIGHFPIERGLRARAAGDAIRVCNTGSDTAPAGWLHWRGDTWRVPALAPRETWTTSEQAPARERTPAIRLFERRSPVRAPARLQPLDGRGADGPAWLMRTEPETPGVRPCAG